jgi:serine/threonine protein kinase
VGTEPARLQERLEAALGPAWGIEREVGSWQDFSGPHVVHTLTEVGTALGTPAYMVPEQVMGAPAMDHYGDLYALGVIRGQLVCAAATIRVCPATICARRRSCRVRCCNRARSLRHSPRHT